jgi:hypothetical protein
LSVKEITDPEKENERLEAMAAEFGYALVPIGDDNDKSRAGLMMIVHESGTKPFGDEFKSPDQIQEFLERVSSGEIDPGDDEDGIKAIDDVEFDQLLHELPEHQHAEANARRNAGEPVKAIAKHFGIKPRPRVAPPTKGKQKKSLAGHADADKIGKLVAAENFVEAGALLGKVKVAAGHGGLGPWLKAAGIHERTARRCMEQNGRQNGQ